MEGVIARTQRDGTIVHVARPYDPAVKKKVWLGTRPTELEAAELVIDHFRGRGNKRAQLITGQVIDNWLGTYVVTLKPKTQKTYHQNIRPFRHAFGDRLVDTLAYLELQQWANGVPKGYVSVAKNAFSWAVTARQITETPFAQIVVRRTPIKEARGLTLDEVRALADCAFDVHREPEASMWAALILFMAGTGLRPNELERLHWRDIDLRAGEVYCEPSKNWKDGRIVLLSIAREGLALIPRGMPDDLVFTNTKGKPIAASSIHYWFDPIRRAAGLPDFEFKQLRHTCGTYLAEQGAAAAVAAADIAMQLRHSDYGRTAERHYIRPAQSRAMERVRDLDSVARRAEIPRLAVASGSHSGGDAA